MRVRPEFRSVISRGIKLPAVFASVAALSVDADPVSLTLFGAGNGVAMGASVDHTLNSIAHKPIVAPYKNVRFASLDGFTQPGMRVSADQKSETGWHIVAMANQREIDVDIETLTPKLTRVRVVVNDGVISKDRATKAAIIDQVAVDLDAQDRSTRLAGRIKSSYQRDRQS